MNQCEIKRNCFSFCGHLDPLSKCEHPHELSPLNMLKQLLAYKLLDAAGGSAAARGFPQSPHQKAAFIYRCGTCSLSV